MAKHLNPLEKEFLIRQFKSNQRIRVSDFCQANNVSETAFRKWLQQYDEEGIESLTRADSTVSNVLPDGIDHTEESYKREIPRLRIELERLKKLYRGDERGWGAGICSFKDEDFSIVDLLGRDYGVADVCRSMGVSRSGYYKWKKRDRTKANPKREQMIELIRETHEKHRTHGYKWTAAYICINTGYSISPNFAYKCFKYLGISAETEHKVHYKPRREKDRFPNLIFSTWETVDRPRQVVVSDMTAFKIGILHVEVTFYFDVFTKEMLTFRVADRRGYRMQYVQGREAYGQSGKRVTERLDQGRTDNRLLHRQMLDG